MQQPNLIVRDISWLSFNQRVLQEAADKSVPLKERIKFLGISSNNLDEFFRVRVAALRRMVELGSKARMHMENDPKSVLEEIQEKVLLQQLEFEHTWREIYQDLKEENIHLVDEKNLTKAQQEYVLSYYNDELRSYIVPLMIQSLQAFPTLNDKSIYLACRLAKEDKSIQERFALVSVPVRHLGRFVQLPDHNGEPYIILLEDVVRFCLPLIFSLFGYDSFSAHVVKMTRDAEIDIDNDVSTNLIQKLQKGLKNRKKGKPVRFVFDKTIDPSLLQYLLKRLGITEHLNIVPGGRIHNFKDFMKFPDVFEKKPGSRHRPFTHALLAHAESVTQVILKEDVMLHFPYNSFDSVIDLLREAAIDPQVISIKITCYRLASRSKIVNALTNAVRNGKQVTVMLELRARFDEEANLEWKEDLEESGVKVLLGAPNEKVHAKVCVIKRKTNNITTHYGFVSTGNLNENTATVYGDHLLLTADRKIMADINKIFSYLENPKSGLHHLQNCKTLLIAPVNMRRNFIQLIDKEIKNAQHKKEAAIIVKVNSLSDKILIEKLSEAARAGVRVKLIIRGICCMYTEHKKFKVPIQAISIVDEYLEHARLIAFHNGGNSKMYISSADWMVRNLDHRVEAACPILVPAIKQELLDILNIQLKDNEKARVLNNELNNEMVEPEPEEKLVRSQVETYEYLKKIHLQPKAEKEKLNKEEITNS